MSGFRDGFGAAGAGEAVGGDAKVSRYAFDDRLWCGWGGGGGTVIGDPVRLA